MAGETPFEVGRVYRRTDIHGEYGGQRQQGIVTPRGQPFVMCVTGSAGSAYGYDDFEDDEGVFHYYGEGQTGSMVFTHGNKALRDHAADGKDLYLFEQERRGYLRFRGTYICAGHYEVAGVPDYEGTPRTAIVFQLTPLDARSIEGQQPVDVSLADLRNAALEGPAVSADAKDAKRRVYARSSKLRLYVRRRADGACEGCGRSAPFEDRAGDPYLEPHHTRRISDGGPDHPRWVIALCPECHARVHYGSDGGPFNATLIDKLASLEPA